MTSNGVALRPASDYLRYLPALYWEDGFLGRFLSIFEDILTPIQVAVNGLPQQFDPALSSSPMLELLAGWVGADRLDGLDEKKWRRLIKAGLVLHGSRGTKKAMRMALEIMTGHRPFITEYSSGLVLGEDASLGLNTSLDSGAPLRFHVAFDCEASDVDTALVHTMIQRYKPAHVTYTVWYRSEAQAAR